ncbi:MAG: site-specific DNA-methyltransferase [Syntrophomonadaceae bacterium]|nr:site-specific DNA-methyltransferase [Syntrophomonadaceae bacterium]
MKKIDLLHGDCLELMQDMPDKSIDMILCDLPYGTTACKWDSVIPFEPLWEQYNRIVKDNGAIVLFGSEPFSSNLRVSNIKNYKYDWKWDKVKPSTGLHAKIMPLKDYEDIIVFYKKKTTYNPQMKESNIRIDKPRIANNGEAFGGKEVLRQHKNNGLSYPRAILRFSNANQNNRVHPTQKPVPLLEYLIKTYTNEGETVLDNCMGSGSTGVACVNTNRNFIGIELDDEYFEIAKQRIERHMRQISIFDLAKESTGR